MAGWAELTVDLSDVEDVQEAISWAEANIDTQLDEGRPSNPPYGERLYCLYAKVPDENRYVHIAGWDPVLPPDDPAWNLPRRRPA
jgi:hypothetical protein